MTRGQPTSAPVTPGVIKLEQNQPFDPLGASSGGRPWLRQASPVLPPAFALAEMAVLVALVVLEYAWDAFPNLTRINPHPYWIAILLLSLQYGTVSGLIAASIAIVGSVVIGLPDPDIEERYFSYLIRVWTQPVLWLLVAMLLGTFRARQIEQRDELLQQAENLRMRGATLLDHATNLRARCNMLERKIAMRETNDSTQLLSSLAKLETAGPGRWAEALETALAIGFPKSQISLYAVDGTQVRHVLTHQRAVVSATSGGPIPMDIESGHPLLAAVVGAGRAVCVVDAEHDPALRGQGVAAVPIFATSDAVRPRAVIGMLKADILPSNQIDTATTARLAIVAAHLAPAMQLGLISSVAESGAGGIVDAGVVPTIRKWRLLKVFGGAQPDGTHG